MTGPLDRELARQRGRRKLDAMKRRTGQLRRRIVATAIVGFVLLWTVVFVQMATGNDPALESPKAARPAPRKPPAPAPETAGVEANRAEAERVEAERAEIERLEAETRELEELEAVTTGQS